ncbi:MAG: hypothetical protein OEY73_02650, partial [Hadesarchaea archaeon]|nr:hypothetical protein [Hadesarchaea archaeon]
MAKFGIPRRTKSQALRGLIIRKNCWTQEEIKILQENYLNMRTSEIAKIIGRSRGAIENKASKLKIRKHHFWTRDEVIKELQELFKIHGYLNRESAAKKRGLADACRRHFGGFNKALIAAGLPVNYGSFPIPPLNPKFGYWLGLVFGDGCVSKGYVCISFTESDIEMVHYFSEVSKELFGRTPSISQIKGRKFTSPFSGKEYERKPLIRASLGSKTISSWIKTNFKHDGKLMIPDLLFEAPIEVKASFLKGFFDAEGSFSVGNLRLSQKDGEILKQIQKMLISFGIESRVSSGKREFVLWITDLHNLEKFNSQIGFGLRRKQEALQSYIEQVKKFRGSINYREVGVSKQMILDVLKEGPARGTEIVKKINLDKANTWAHLKNLWKEGKIQKIKKHPRVVFWALPEHECGISPEKVKELAIAYRRWTDKSMVLERIKELAKENNGFASSAIDRPLAEAARRFFG